MIRGWLERLTDALSSSQHLETPPLKSIGRVLGVALIGMGPFVLLGLAHPEPVARKNGIAVIHPWSRGTALVGDQLAVYVTFENSGGAPDRLVGVETPLAHHAVLKTIDGRAGATRAIEFDELRIAPNTKVGLRPEDRSISLVGLKERIEPGKSIPITFIFSGAGRLSAQVRVESPGQPAHPDHS